HAYSSFKSTARTNEHRADLSGEAGPVLLVRYLRPPRCGGGATKAGDSRYVIRGCQRIGALHHAIPSLLYMATPAGPFIDARNDELRGSAWAPFRGTGGSHPPGNPRDPAPRAGWQ